MSNCWPARTATVRETPYANVAIERTRSFVVVDALVCLVTTEWLRTDDVVRPGGVTAADDEHAVNTSNPAHNGTARRTINA